MLTDFTSETQQYSLNQTTQTDTNLGWWVSVKMQN